MCLIFGTGWRRLTTVLSCTSAETFGPRHSYYWHTCPDGQRSGAIIHAKPVLFRTEAVTKPLQKARAILEVTEVVAVIRGLYTEQELVETPSPAVALSRFVKTRFRIESRDVHSLI